MNPLHLNETTYFDQNDTVLTQTVKQKRQTTQRVVWNFSSSSSLVSLESCSSGRLFKAFNVLFLYQIWQNLHANDGLTSDYTLIWFYMTDRH